MYLWLYFLGNIVQIGIVSLLWMNLPRKPCGPSAFFFVILNIDWISLIFINLFKLFLHEWVLVVCVCQRTGPFHLSSHVCVQRVVHSVFFAILFMSMRSVVLISFIYDICNFCFFFYYLINLFFPVYNFIDVCSNFCYFFFLPRPDLLYFSLGF